MPDVEVRLGAVLGDEHLAVLERVHRAGIDVEVRIEFLHRHLQAARGQQLPRLDAVRPLPERRNHAAADEEVLGGGLRCLRNAGKSNLRDDGQDMQMTNWGLPTHGIPH